MNKTEDKQKDNDLLIFADSNSNKCTIDNDSNHIENCDYLKRIAVTLKYYQSFQQNKIKNKSIIQFYQNLYSNIYGILDDHIHFISKHNYHLISITKELQKEYGIKSCEIEDCDVISRHYREKINEEISENDDDRGHAFYID